MWSKTLYGSLSDPALSAWKANSAVCGYGYAIAKANAKLMEWLSYSKRSGKILKRNLAFPKTGCEMQSRVACNKSTRRKWIYFRFNLLGENGGELNPFAHVPFELLFNTHQDKYIRAISPVARRLCLPATEYTGTPLIGAQSCSGDVLFIRSNADGMLELKDALFEGSSNVYLEKLSLNPEYEAVKKARVDASASLPDLLDLLTGADTLKQLEDDLTHRRATGQLYQIIHYAGHSFRTDDGTVYLVLPGLEPSRLQRLSISDFAQLVRQEELKLIILSSCQSSSPDGVFRLVQAGIPAAVGFNWKIDDDEAPYFTYRLHEQLAKQVPLAQAFHCAVSAAQMKYGDTSTFASPMLLVQDKVWAN